MKTPDRVNVRGVVDPEALRILRLFEEISVTSPGARRPRKGALAVVSFGDVSALVRVESRRYLSAAAAWMIAQRASDEPRERVLVVADQSTAQGREILRARGIAYACGSGRLSLSMPGLLLRIEMPRGDARPAPAGRWRLSGIAGRVAQLLLLEPGREWSIRHLSREAGASAGLTHGVIARLEADGILTATGAGSTRVRRLANREALLDVWCEEQLDRSVEVVRCHRPERGPRELVAAIAQRIDAAGITYALTRAAAVMAMTSVPVTVSTVEAWIDSASPFEEVLDAVGSRHTSGTANLILTHAHGDAPLAFSRKHEGVSCVNPVRLYYDLAHDPRRDREQFRQLREAIVRG